MNISKKHKKIKQNGYRWKRRKCITWYNAYGMFITRDKIRNTIDYEGEDELEASVIEHFSKKFMDI